LDCLKGQHPKRELAEYVVAILLASVASNHEKPVRPVAPELVDEAIFPIEIGLHRARGNIRVDGGETPDQRGRPVRGDDDFAIKSASRLVDSHDVELWQMDRPIARFAARSKQTFKT
jgi:hypothetical protein